MKLSELENKKYFKEVGFEDLYQKSTVFNRFSGLCAEGGARIFKDSAEVIKVTKKEYKAKERSTHKKFKNVL